MCAFYALLAAAAVVELLSWTGIVADAKARTVPVVFVAHALAGGVALVTGILQLNRRLRARSRRLHRILGRIYVAAIWAASTGGLWSALVFRVGPVSRALFIAAAVLWFAVTAVGFDLARRRQVTRHRAWMIRSFALSLFFVTFEPWVWVLESIGLGGPVAYPVGLFLGWSVNLLLAELWLRRTSRRSQAGSTKTRISM